MPRDVLRRVQKTIDLLENMEVDGDKKSVIENMVGVVRKAVQDVNLPQVPLTDLPRNQEYYSTQEFVRYDLEAFAVELSKQKGQDFTVLDLNTSNILSLEITCSNGKLVKGGTYLANAGIQLGLAKNTTKAESKRKEILAKLLQIAGFEVAEFAPRDQEYYQNAKNVKHDLEAFAVELSKQKGQDFTVLDLCPKNISSLEITCANGGKVKGATYLNNAAIQLGLAKNTKETGNKQKEILAKLLQIAGYEVKKFAPRDKEYYQNPKNVKHDLEAFATVVSEKRSKKISLLNLTAGSISSVKEITCINGEKVNGGTYLNNATTVLGLAKNPKEVKSKRTKVLEKLLEIVGFKLKKFERDEAYYLNSEFVKTDLESFAALLSKQKGRIFTCLDLNTSNISSLEITCANGEKVKGVTYLKNAGVALGLAQNTAEAESKQKEILAKLLQIAGYNSEFLIDQEFEKLKELKLEEAIALLGTSDPLKLKIYLQFAYPELDEEEINKLVTRSVKAIYDKENVTKDTRLLLTHKINLPEPEIITEIPVQTTENTVIISGKTNGADFVYFSGTYNKRTRVNPDGTFTEKIPLRTGIANKIKWMSLNTEKEERSPQSEYVVFQTSKVDDTERVHMLVCTF